MKTAIKIFVGLLFVLFLVVSTQFALLYVDELRANERKVYLDTKAREIVASLSTRDKLGQVIHLAIPGKTLDEVAIQEIRKIHPGGIIHFGKNLGTKKEIIDLNQSLQNLAAKEKLPPFLISTDQEGGRVFRVRDGVAQFPGAMAVGQTLSDEIGYQVGFITSYDLHSLGINFLLAPSLDVNNNPKNPVINTRSFGSDVQRVQTVAGAYERGARSGGAIPVIKHFPGHGDTDVDSHLGLPVIRKTLEELESLELIPFRSSLNSGAPVVMTAHILYPKIDPEYPTTLSSILLTDILRKRLGFDGVVITDAMEMHAISKNYEKIRPGVKALLAGADILLLTSWGDTSEQLIRDLKQAEENGEFLVNGENRLDTAVYRQIRLKLEYGVYTDNGFSPAISNENLLRFMQERKSNREAQYKIFTQNPEFVDAITRKTIRAYPQEFPGVARAELAQVCAYFSHPKLTETWISLGGSLRSPAKLANDLKNPKLECTKIVAYAQNEKSLGNLDRMAQQTPNKDFVILYPGTPFVQLPVSRNVLTLFSLSVTDSSYKALAESVLTTQPIPKLDLILP